MALITCKIITTSQGAIQDAHATIKCKDQNGLIIAQFESRPTSSGTIPHWYSKFGPLVSSLTETVQIPPSSTMSLNLKLPNHQKWRQIQADLNITGLANPIQITLSVNDTSYLFEYGSAQASATETTSEFEPSHESQQLKRKRAVSLCEPRKYVRRS